MWRNLLAVAFVSVLFSGFVWAEDNTLKREKEKHKKGIEKADAELRKAKKKHEETYKKLKRKLIKVYEDAIKRTTKKGDLEFANKLLKEKKALIAGEDGSKENEVEKGGDEDRDTDKAPQSIVYVFSHGEFSMKLDGEIIKFTKLGDKRYKAMVTLRKGSELFACERQGRQNPQIAVIIVTPNGIALRTTLRQNAWISYQPKDQEKWNEMKGSKRVRLVEGFDGVYGTPHWMEFKTVIEGKKVRLPELVRSVRSLEGEPTYLHLQVTKSLLKKGN